MTEPTSRLRDFFKFLASTQGDLASISGPPFLLAPFSVVEVADAWLRRPSLLAAIIASYTAQFYLGESPDAGLKKPLNAFLGEVFLASYADGDITLHLASEQVSYHPSITAVHIWDDGDDISMDGYVRVEMTFSGSLNVRKTGHVVVRIHKYDEHYLIPFPSVTVRGFLSDWLYAKLYGAYSIISSSRCISEITYSGQGIFGRYG